MNNKNHTIAKILLLIPIAIFFIIVLCLLIAFMLETPTNKGVFYSLFALVGLAGMFLSPLPCLMMSLAGTIFAVIATKEGSAKSPKFIVLGAIELLFHVAGVCLAISLFNVSMGV